MIINIKNVLKNLVNIANILRIQQLIIYLGM